MLTFYGSAAKDPIAVNRNIPAISSAINWIDALDPSPEDISFLERIMKIHIPSHDDLVEIESSSRLAVEGDTLTISLPATIKDASGYPASTPVGLVVSAARLATLRFAHLPSFESLAKQICAKGNLSEGGMGATVSILEIIIDHIADLLERIGADLDAISRSIFATGALSDSEHRPRHSNEKLRELLKTVGRNGDLISKVSESLLGLSRIAPFLVAKGGAMVTPDLKVRIETIGLDAKSLHEFQDHLANKTQFLLDTLLGLANIEQNNVFRVLTVVSVIGIPPTFFASMYGMNFKTMPEYDWSYGYAYGLTLIIASALIPAIYFKVKGWW